MLSELVKYKNFDDEEVEETWEFNLSTAEVTKMELGMKGGLKAFFERIIKEDDRPEIVKAFDQILLGSVGRRVGKLFLKTPEVINEFRYSGAYEVVFLKLLTDAEYSANFVNHVLPKDMADKLRAATPVAVDLPVTPTPALTPNLTPETAGKEFQDFLAWKQQNTSPLGI